MGARLDGNTRTKPKIRFGSRFTCLLDVLNAFEPRLNAERE
jgi:hypothetical protein